jgi:hypothetical protein
MIGTSLATPALVNSIDVIIDHVYFTNALTFTEWFVLTESST